MFSSPQIDPGSSLPLYKQLHDQLRYWISTWHLPRGEKLPSTRELAGSLGLNRTTVSAAYDLLESEGLIRGHVGRGSFVTGEPAAAGTGLDWSRLLEDQDRLAAGPSSSPAERATVISFATSCPASELFPLDEVRSVCREVLG